MGRAYGVSPKPGIIRDEVCCGAIALLDGVGSGDARAYCRRCKGQVRLRNLIRRFRILTYSSIKVRLSFRLADSPQQYEIGWIASTEQEEQEERALLSYKLFARRPQNKRNKVINMTR